MSNGRKRKTWEETAILLAFDIAKYRSEDPYVQVGAVAIKNDNSFILGYNGAPKGINIDWSNRDERRSKVLHAEENVLNFLLFGECKIFAVTALPCPVCMKSIANKGIKKIYYERSFCSHNRFDQRSDQYCAGSLCASK